MLTLDDRLECIARLVLERTEALEHPVVADIGCDHGRLTASLLERKKNLFVVASDVSASSLHKAELLLDRLGFSDRAALAQSDGLENIDRRLDAAVMAGMGAETILSIVRKGREKLGNAELIVQANVDLPLLRSGLRELGYRVIREEYSLAAGRRYATFLACPEKSGMLTEKEALLGTALNGTVSGNQAEYFLWQRRVRTREMEEILENRGESALQRMKKNSREVEWMEEVLGTKDCTVADVLELVNAVAPFDSAEEWDNVGLLFGRRGAKVTRVLVALDLAENVLDQAEKLGAELIVTHHPILFSPTQRVTDETREGRLMLRMAQLGISHIAAHTNLDKAPGGVNDTLMRTMGLPNAEGEGFMRTADLPQPVALEELRRKAERVLHAVVRSYGAPDTVIHRLACCSGAGGSESMDALEKGADCLLTGEIKHHEALNAVDAGLCVLEAGHFETENPVCKALAETLQKSADAVQYKLVVFCSEGNPFGR